MSNIAPKSFEMFEGQEYIGSSETEIFEYLKSNQHLHCFRISREAVKASDREVCRQICNDLADMNLLRLPFPAIIIENRELITPNDLAKFGNEARGLNLIGGLVCSFLICDTFAKSKKGASFPRPQFAFEKSENGSFERKVNLGTGQFSNFYSDGRNAHGTCPPEILLIYQKLYVQSILVIMATLAAKNAIKITSTNTRIGTKKKMKPKFMGPLNTIYLSTTTIDIPRQLPDDPNHPAKRGTSPRAHLRRGHIHTFASGTGRAERIKKWIEPMFVNADADFVAQARNYKVRT